MERTFGPKSPPLCGEVRVPGDKSLSHRAVLFAAMATGISDVYGLLNSADVRSTIAAVGALGASVRLVEMPDRSLDGAIDGWGARGPVVPNGSIYCGNSGTTARLLMGMLAGWPIDVTLTGDESLSLRPMRRVTEPLSSMGARFDTSGSGTLPVTVHGTAQLTPLEYHSPVASAQVKTAVLLAGMRAAGATTVHEPALSRDHTERLLPAFGIDVDHDRRHCRTTLSGPQVPTASDVRVPADPSSAAFLAAAALLVPGSKITLPGVALNPTRTGFVDVFERMGASIRVTEDAAAGLEPVGTITVRHTAGLQGTTVVASEVPSLVDEIPVLALVATRAEGTTRFEGVAELRVKESDRLQAIVDGLSALGATVRAGEDWLEVDGPARLHSAVLDSLGDHRLAMTWALAGMAGEGSVTVRRFEAVDVSYPQFLADLNRLGA